MNLPKLYDKLKHKQRKAVRAEYVRQQKGKCWYCQGNLDEQPPEAIKKKYRIDLKWFPEGFLKNPIHLHHDHDTGLTEGVVHAWCNGVLWQYFGK